MTATASASGSRFTMSTGEKIVLIALLTGAGVLLGFLLPWLGTVAARFPIPFGEPIEKLSAFDSPLIVALRPLIGAALGVVAGVLMTASTPVVVVTDREVRISEGGEQRVLPREEIAGVHRRGGNVVIETPTGRVLFDGEIPGDRQEVAAAFRQRGYPWEMAAE